MNPRDVYIKQQVVTLQCRGPDGNLEKDAGVLIDMTDIDNERKFVSCPYLQKPERCKVKRVKLGKEDYAKCFLY